MSGSEYTIHVPASIGREKSKPIRGVDAHLLIVTAIWGFLSLVFLFPIAIFSLPMGAVAFLLVMFLFWWAIYVKFLRSTKHIYKALLFISFLLRIKKGENIVAKYHQPLSYLMRSYPVEKIYDNGLIKYSAPTNPWGMMLVESPVREEKENIERYYTKITDFFNSLTSNIKVHIMNSSYEDDSLDLINQLRERIRKDIPIELKTHLTSLHEEIDQNAEPVIDRRVTITIIFDNIIDYDDALIKKTELLPGMIQGLADAGVFCTVVTGKDKIIKMFKTPFDVILE